MKLEEARFQAQQLVDRMRPYCKKIEIAGSIRREKQDDIKDIEIVAVPEMFEQLDPEDLFGERTIVTNALYLWATSQRDVRWIKPGTSEIIPWHINPEGRYWRGIVKGVKLDLFLPTEDRFWPTFLIRTGSADFSQAVVTHARKVGYQFADGRLCLIGHDSLLPVTHLTSEEQIFDQLALEYVAPRDRTGAEAVKPLWRAGIVR